MLKQLVSSTALVAAALSSSPAFAADDARSAIHISANIPTQQFHVMPRDPEFGKNEVMHYNPVNNTLSSLRQTYDVKNTEGSIQAYIEGGLPRLNGGASPSDYIPLTVFFNDVILTNTPREVVSDAASTPGTQVELRITNMNPTVRPDMEGLYTGDITLVFDAVPRITL